MAAAKQRGCSLVITVDCGIRSFEPLEWARDNDLDVIVTDHHISDPERGNPPAVAVVNPNQPGCPYPDKDLAGVGVAYKLAQALLRDHGRDEVVRSFLKIAAIGTVADVMRLSGENRSIVALGLRDITATTNFGLRALMEAAGCRSDMTSYDIGFRIAPRINAAGRMDVANHVIELFEAGSFGEARKIAELLDKKNRERQTIQQLITEKAIEQSESNGNLGFIVVAGEGWHRGVIGLAASRIAERLHRPSIVLSTENGIAHGSARSIPNFHLLDALSSCGDLFDQYGGHAAAAGMKMSAENIDELRDRLNVYAENAISVEDRTPALRIDARVASQSLSLELLDEIAKLEPFGAGNPKPIFLTDGLEIRFDPTVMKDKHLKLYLIDSGGRRFEAVWWDGVERSIGRTLTPGTRIQLAYTPEANKWQGNTRLQLVVEDIREHN
ncbi:MAG TPA: single-stranded-DNA-specific exonuclease RecJ [Blastocatellia bacterium]|nr:single-stranded-DNA-specific exonuclease RecJ [Blastocatellia bacterium]